MEERESTVERHRFSPNSTPESSLIGTRIPKRAIALLRCPRPGGAGGTNGARFHPPPHSFRRLWIGMVQRAIPFRNSGLTLAPRRVGQSPAGRCCQPTRADLTQRRARSDTPYRHHATSVTLDPLRKTQTLTRIPRMNANSMERHLSPAEAERGEFQRDARHTDEEKD